MSGVYNAAKSGFVDGTIDWDDPDRIKVLLISTTGDADFFEPDDATIQAILAKVDITELTGTEYTPGFETINTEGNAGRKKLVATVTKNLTTDKAELKASNSTWVGINVGATKIAAAIIFHQPAAAIDDSTLIPIAYINTGGFPILTNGGDITIAYAAQGILNLA